MKKKKKSDQQILLHHGHQLRTRRDFLASGLISGGAFLSAPSLLSMIAASNGYGQELRCNAQQSGSLMSAFLSFDLAGGANFAGSNVMVGKQGGQTDFLNNYQTLGLPGDMNPQTVGINTDLGLAFHPDSAILRGILAQTSESTRANIEGLIFATSSSDDTGNNPHNPNYWINKAGLAGELTAALGSAGNVSGGRAQAPASSINPTARPVQITNPNDALGLVDPGKLASLLSPQKASRIMQAIKTMSESQITAFQQKDLSQQIKDLVRCGYLKTSDVLNKYSADALDPNQDADVAAVFDNLTDADQARTATITKLVLDGMAGVGTIQKGGYDYHNGTRATGEQRDFQAGSMIGQALELAARKNRDLVIYVFTDGGVTSNGQIDNSENGRGKGRWVGDSSQRSSAFMLVYKTDGKPEIRSLGRQIGAFNDSGAVNNNVLKTSNSVENLTKAVVANYLALHGKEGDLAKIVGDDPFGADLESYLGFAKLR